MENWKIEAQLTVLRSMLMTTYLRTANSMFPKQQADVLAGILNDFKNPRKLEAILNSGFAAKDESLRAALTELANIFYLLLDVEDSIGYLRGRAQQEITINSSKAAKNV